MKRPKIKSRMSLREARTFNEVCTMPRDNYQWRDFSLLTDGKTVWLSGQKIGESSSQKFEISKGAFDRLVDSYVRRVLVTAPRGKK